MANKKPAAKKVAQEEQIVEAAPKVAVPNAAEPKIAGSGIESSV